jgi:hypothetical protein
LFIRTRRILLSFYSDLSYDSSTFFSCSQLSSALLLDSLSVSKETSVYHTATGRFPRIRFHGNAFLNSLRSNSSTCHNMKLVLNKRPNSIALVSVCDGLFKNLLSTVLNYLNFVT